MFRRQKDQPVIPVDAAPSADAPQGKGRPTPTRKEAEAARKAAKAGVPSDPKEARKAARDADRRARYEQQQALRNGDGSRLPARDAGPVRAWVRDHVDSRISAGELFIPIAVLVLIMGFVRVQWIQEALLWVWGITLLAVVADSLWLIYRLRGGLAREFPDQDTKGAVTYGVMRALQLRSLRLPKPKVRWNGQPVVPKQKAKV
ncbi:MAG TPA: DUF3043 domain-containing protein [Candidatus Nanopelagicales bacterium]|nr:DUF3043 domain-containing protein [Candidatus Nanopelagicales bacterium]